MNALGRSRGWILGSEMTSTAQHNINDSGPSRRYLCNRAGSSVIIACEGEKEELENAIL